MVISDCSVSRCAWLTGLALSEGAEGPELDGRPVQCLSVPASAFPALEGALAGGPLGCGRQITHAADLISGEYCLVLERGQPLPAGSAAAGPGAPELLGEHAGDWQGRHPASAVPEGAGYRRGVLQQQARERATVAAAGLDEPARAVLNAELHHQSLYRFEDLPLAGSYWRSVRVYPEGAGLADLVVPPAPVPAFWQLARIALAVAVDAEGRPDAERYRAVLIGYHHSRPLAAIERGAAPTLLRLAALDDWLERLERGEPGAVERTRLAGLQEHAARLQGIWVPAAA